MSKKKEKEEQIKKLKEWESKMRGETPKISEQEKKEKSERLAKERAELRATYEKLGRKVPKYLLEEEQEKLKQKLIKKLQKKELSSPNTKPTLLLSDTYTLKISRILENYQDYQEIVVIASRGEGKTFQTVHWMLPQIDETQKKFLWLRRYPDDSRYALLDYFQARVNEYCDSQGLSYYQQKKIWDVIVRGTFYKEDNNIVFAELQHYGKARGAFSENPALIIFDEALPTLLDWRNGYLTNEPDKFKDFWDSMWRNREKPKPTILHIANAYDRTYHRLADWDQEIEEIAQKELWKEGDRDNKDWEWEQEKEVLDKDTQKMVKKKLIFFRKARDMEGWPKFFTKKGDLNVREIPAKHLLPLDIYNSKYLLSRTRKGSILYLTNLEYIEEKKRKKLVDYHLDKDTFFLTPANWQKELLSSKVAKQTKQEWTDWINEKVLFFADFNLRNEVIGLLTNRTVI